MTNLPPCSPLSALPANGLLAPGAHNREIDLLGAQEIERRGAGGTHIRVITLRAGQRHDEFPVGARARLAWKAVGPKQACLCPGVTSRRRTAMRPVRATAQAYWSASVSVPKCSVS
jgi:hypothetical protein